MHDLHMKKIGLLFITCLLFSLTLVVIISINLPGLASVNAQEHPEITIISPQNTTYNTNSIPLEYAVDGDPFYTIWYILDNKKGKAKRLEENTVLSDLSEGSHNVRVIAKDFSGVEFFNEIVYFTVDTTPPTITITSPQEKIYSTDDVNLIYTIDEPASWIAYNLNGKNNFTIVGNTTLSDLIDGEYILKIFARDLAGNTGVSNLINFLIDDTAPVVTISSPAAGSYRSSALPKLVHSASDNLDPTPSLVSEVGWSTAEGRHTVVVTYVDDAGNEGSASRTYTIDDTAPSIMLSSPTNSIYSTSDIPLEFSADEILNWIGYSLDGANNVTISGDSLLSGLSEGSHSLIVYGNDAAGNMGVSNVVDFSVDTTPPSITVSSPTNSIYSTSNIQLTFSVNEKTSWMGYSLDGQNIITISGNTTIINLSDGLHNLIVYANDTLSNMGVSDTVNFAVQLPKDTIPPIITITSPIETTYSKTNVFLDFAINEEVSWIGYSLDNQDNVTITGDSLLYDLSEGSHSIVIYAIDTAGNIGKSSVVQFNILIPIVDTTPPLIEINSPVENSTYTIMSVGLNFSINEQVSWMAYSLDGSNNITISGNATISALSEGSHSIVVYATDLAGNTGASSTVEFTISIDTTPPSITVVSPQERSYLTSEITLDFTINEPATWIGYSLDGEENVTITGSIIMSGLSVGSHNITVFAADAVGNVGSSVVVQFVVSAATVDTTPPTVVVNSPTNSTYDTNQVSLSFTVNEEPTLKFYSLDGKANVTVVHSTVISGLSKGEHQLVLYAEDSAGNVGASKVVVFVITSENDDFSQLWVVGIIGIIAGVGLIFSVYIASDLIKGHNKGTEKIQNFSD